MDILKLIKDAENELFSIYQQIDNTCELNSKKVLEAFKKNRLSEHSYFNTTTGYGYGDSVET